MLLQVNFVYIICKQFMIFGHALWIKVIGHSALYISQLQQKVHFNLAVYPQGG